MALGMGHVTVSRVSRARDCCEAASSCCSWCHRNSSYPSSRNSGQRRGVSWPHSRHFRNSGPSLCHLPGGEGGTEAARKHLGSGASSGLRSGAPVAASSTPRCSQLAGGVSACGFRRTRLLLPLARPPDPAQLQRDEVSSQPQWEGQA